MTNTTKKVKAKTKFKDKFKKVSGKLGAFVKKRPKVIGSLVAVAILATGGTSAGVIEIADIVNIAVQVMTSVE